MLDNVHTGTLCPDFQLVNCRSTERIRRSHQHLFALALQLVAKLADRGRLSGTIDTDHHDNGRLGGIFQCLILAQHLADDLLNHAHDLLRILDTSFLDAFPQGFTDLYRSFRSQIAGDHGFFQLIKQVVVDLGKAAQHLLHAGNHCVLGLSQAVPNLRKKALFLFRLRCFRLGFVFEFRFCFRLGFFCQFCFWFSCFF